MEFAFNTLLSRFLKGPAFLLPVTISFFSEASPSDSRAQLNSCLNVNDLMRAFSTLSAALFLTCQVPMGMEKACLASSSPWQPVHADLCLSVSRLATLQSHPAIATRETAVDFDISSALERGKHPRPHLLPLCSFLVRNYLTPEVGGLRATGWEGVKFWM